MARKVVRIAHQIRSQNGGCFPVPSQQSIVIASFKLVKGSALRVEPFGLFHVRQTFRRLARTAQSESHPKIAKSRAGCEEGYSPFNLGSGLVISPLRQVQTAQYRVSCGIRVIQSNGLLLQFDRTIQGFGSAVLAPLKAKTEKVVKAQLHVRVRISRIQLNGFLTHPSPLRIVLFRESEPVPHTTQIVVVRFEIVRVLADPPPRLLQR